MDTTDAVERGLSPTTKLKVFKIEAIQCNGKPLHKNTELSDEDIEKIWTTSLGRDWIEIDGFKQKKVTFTKQKKEVTNIKIIYELCLDEPLREIVDHPEIQYQRLSLFGPETFTLKVQGLQDLREAEIGEIVTVNIRGTDFEVKAFEILEWMERFGVIVGDHRYSQSALFFSDIYPVLCLVSRSLRNLHHIACQLGLFLDETRRAHHFLNCFNRQSPFLFQTHLIKPLKQAVAFWLLKFGLKQFDLLSLLVPTSTGSRPFEPTDLSTLEQNLKILSLLDLLNQSNLIDLVLTPLFSLVYSVLKNLSGKNTDGISIKLKLTDFLPEWLPIKGKKLRIYHHGIKTQCNGCYGLGHGKWNCKEEHTNWRGYVDRLFQSGKFTKEMFGSWLEGPPKQNKDEEDLREMLRNPNKLKQMITLFNAMKDQDKGKEKGPGKRSYQPNQKQSQKPKAKPNPRFQIQPKGQNQSQNQSQKPDDSKKNPPAKKKREN